MSNGPNILLWIVEDEIQKEKQSTTIEISSRVSQEIAATAQQQFEAFLHNYMKTHVLKAKFEKTSIPSESYRHNVFRKRTHDDHLNVDAPPDGEKSKKKQNTSGKSKYVKDSTSSKQHK
ncbi:hypothetical protein Tco_0516645 [Tanacetum coccineum]